MQNKFIRGSLILLLLIGIMFSTQEPEQAVANSDRPNIVFILTDDQTTDMLRFMPEVRKHLTDKGIRFSNTFATNPWCCPSRATILRGQYAHNTDIWTVKEPAGGHEKFVSTGQERDTVATWIQDAGYSTGYIGRYLNHYNTTDVPAGYDFWFGRIRGEPGDRNIVNANGTKREFFIHETDMFSKKAQSFIENRSNKSEPFFLQVGTWAPHSPGAPPDRYKDSLAEAKPLDKPSVNEHSVADKPAYVRKQDYLTQKEMRDIRLDYRERVRSLLAVDDLVGDVVSKLRETGELNNTYIFFWSDNGYLHGEHRLTRKRLPYEESVRFPLTVRGPGVPEGQIRGALLGNHDLAPTFSEIAGANTPGFVDGSSFVSLLDGTGAYRDVVLSESKDVSNDDKPGWKMARTQRYSYIEYDTGEKEMYDLSEDPYQLVNIAGQGLEVEAELKTKLEALKTCSSDECGTAEGF